MIKHPTHSQRAAVVMVYGGPTRHTWLLGFIFDDDVFFPGHSRYGGVFVEFLGGGLGDN
jgi:hypothetical protein